MVFKVNAYYTCPDRISSILITRFMLELRAVDRAVVWDLADLSGTGGDTSDSTTTPIELSTVVFSDKRTCSTAVSSADSAHAPAPSSSWGVRSTV